MSAGPPCWVDGRLRPAGEAALAVDDSSYGEGRGCYTTVRIAEGLPRLAERHVARLLRDARALGLPEPDPRRLRQALDELGRAAFAGGEGIARLQLSRDRSGGLHVVGVARPLGPDPRTWRAVTASRPHPGSPVPGAKLSQRLHFALAGEAAARAGAQEALFFDAAGRLVEGARSNLVLQDTQGRLTTPPLERGAVAGVALEVLREALPELRSRDATRRDLRRAAAVVAVNAVRGARAIASLDGEPLGHTGEDLARRLGELIARG